MKQFVIILIGVCLALSTSCSKEEEVEKPINNSEPVVPMSNHVMTGEFEGEWNNLPADPTNGSIVVSDEYIIIDELPTEMILQSMISIINISCLSHPELREQTIDSIGNVFFASSYKYPKTGLEIKYEMDSFSKYSYTTKTLSIKNMWSEISTAINIDYEQPQTGEAIVIDPAEPNIISFSVEADGVPYRIDLVSKDHECDVSFNMDDNPWSVPGMWIIQYWFNTYRIYNLQTGKHWDIKVYYQMHRDHDTEDTVQLIFNATKLKGSTEERVIFH